MASNHNQMGIVTYALGIHQRHRWAGRHPGLPPALAFLEECHALGAGGLQIEFTPETVPDLEAFRRRAEEYEMRIEAIIVPPFSEAEVPRFEREVLRAKEVGASVARTVILPGRRYEQFRSFADFAKCAQRGRRSLELAEPILARHRFRLAVENHKDQRVAEKLETLRQLGSEYVGLCVDVGNNFPLLEDPLATVRAFAPHAFTVHLKDQAVREYAEGYLLADVALGEGFLELPEMVAVLRQARPGVGFYFETITRDPIKVPLLTNAYWATLADVPARELARTVRVLKTQSYPRPFVTVSELPVAEQLELERRNVERSLVYARERLGL